jgi:tetratricopeptide (TPR) repeat protein
VKKTDKANQTMRQNALSDLTLRVILALVSAFLYINTTGYQFTLDDDMFYLKHASVQKGLSALPELFTKGSLNQFDGTTGLQPYRPITLISFALEKQFFNNSPVASHFFNVLLYVLLIQVLYQLLRKLFHNVKPLLIACIVMIYAVHPIHTEVVCSVKSRDEILAALFGFLAWLSILKATDLKSQIVSAFFLLLAMLSKESAIAFLVIIPLSKWLIKEETILETLRHSLFHAAVALLFLGVRFAVVGTDSPDIGVPLLANVLHGAQNLGEASATRMVILFHYLRLTILPWPLNWDYSFNQIPIVDWPDLTALFSVVVHGGLLIVALIHIKKNRWLSFIILYYFISSAPTNNLFFINGATLGERFLFVPSLAFSLAFVLMLDQFLTSDTQADKSKKTLYYSLAVVILFSYASLVRSADWKDNLSLFERGVEVSPNSSRTHYSLGSSYFDRALKTTDPLLRKKYMAFALLYYKSSLDIMPDNFQALYNSGLASTVNGDTLSAIRCYRSVIALKKDYMNAYNNLGTLYQALANLDSAHYYYEKALNLDPQNPVLLVNLASIYSLMARYSDALRYLKLGDNADPGNITIIEGITVVSFLYRDYDQAIAYASKALAINSNHRKCLAVLADTYQALGNMEESNKYRQRWSSLGR